MSTRCIRVCAMWTGRWGRKNPEATSLEVEDWMVWCVGMEQMSRHPHMCRFCPLASVLRWRRRCFTQSLFQSCEVWRVLTTTSDVGNVTLGQGVPDH